MYVKLKKCLMQKNVSFDCYAVSYDQIIITFVLR